MGGIKKVYAKIVRLLEFDNNEDAIVELEKCLKKGNNMTSPDLYCIVQLIKCSDIIQQMYSLFLKYKVTIDCCQKLFDVIVGHLSVSQNYSIIECINVKQYKITSTMLLDIISTGNVGTLEYVVNKCIVAINDHTFEGYTNLLFTALPLANIMCTTDDDCLNVNFERVSNLWYNNVLWTRQNHMMLPSDNQQQVVNLLLIMKYNKWKLPWPIVGIIVNMIVFNKIMFVKEPMTDSCL